jgi:predicted 3-demethylubiquinone-9 3-methyltransferase (glyoxalase superfamily)
MQKITTFLWFNDNAEQAVKFYTSIFKNSKTIRTSYTPPSVAKNNGGKPGSVLCIEFQLAGQNFIAMNGGPQVTFNQAISLMVQCDTQAELDRYWKKLTTGGGKAIACGWLQDKFGLSWQIVPKDIIKLISDKDPARVDRVMQAVMDSTKFNLKKIQSAAKAKSKIGKH